MIFFHKTVLIDEAVEGLNILDNGIYVDATIGGGGLSQRILSKLNSGKLIGIDVDPDAICHCKNKFKNKKNVFIVNSNFIDIDNILLNLNINHVDGIAVDLGVSSYQIDCASRGFSYIHDAPLDMRMGKEGRSAYDIVNFFSEKDLSDLIWKNGEERFSKRIARKICSYRLKKKIETTIELSKIIEDAVPKFAGGHPSKRTFQALRIEVNNELENLRIFLDKCLKVLNPRGRLAVISFHSLEDRIVKKKFDFWRSNCICPVGIPICICKKVKQVELVNKKVIMSGENEIEDNPRCKSAKLRICQKI